MWAVEFCFIEITIISKAFLVDTILYHHKSDYITIKKKKYKKGLSDVQMFHPGFKFEKKLCYNSIAL